MGINDLYDYKQMAYLLKYDSVYGTMPQDIIVDGEKLLVNNKPIRLFSKSNPNDLSLKELNIDVLLQCSGIFLTQDSNQPYVDNGAKKLIISTPAIDDMPTYIYGVNHKEYQGEAIISNSSCSANAIVPIFKIIDKHFGIKGALMHMFHSYTAYQNLLDSNHYSSDIRRARSATQNIIPLTSSAARATSYFFPHLEDNLYARSIRIPVSSTTMYDLSIKIDGVYRVSDVIQAFEDDIPSLYDGILEMNAKHLVSSDYIGDMHSAIIERLLIDVSGGNLLRVSAWQDNEYGYAMRLVDMTKVVTSL